MTKILYVTGDEYSAMYIEDGVGVEEAYRQAAESEGKKTFIDDNGYAECEVLEFGEVDFKFIEFIRNNIQDYDVAKHKNFYEIDSEGVR